MPANILVTTLILIILIAILILIERKALAAAQRRLGPSILGRHGFLQIIADVVKPLFKRKLLKKTISASVLGLIVLCYFLSQVVSANLFAGLAAVTMVSGGEYLIILQLICGSLACLLIVYLGYFSGSKYSIIGSIRSVISESSNDTASLFIFLVVFSLCGGTTYETLIVTLGFIIFIFIIFIVMFVILFYVFIMSQRSPADLIENEGEIVAGYNLEYSAADLLVIYFSEYFHLFNAGYQYIYVYCGIAFCLQVIIYTTLVNSQLILIINMWTHFALIPTFAVVLLLYIIISKLYERRVIIMAFIHSIPRERVFFITAVNIYILAHFGYLT